MTSALDSGWFPTQEGKFVPWWGKLMLSILKKSGNTPKHIAFILDGNRRYAKTRGLPSSVDGHLAGFDRLTHVLDWCREADIKEVTVYAFSIENFKRSKEEVDGLFAIAKTKFHRLLNEEAMLAEKKVCFRFFGQIYMLPVDLQKLIAQIEERTKDYTAGFVNVCLAYTSRAEVTAAMNNIRLGVAENLLQDEDISTELIDACLDTRNSHPIDMLLRTSGEHRLSDFLLWQSSNVFIHFEYVLWPEFTFWHFLKAVYAYQCNAAGIEEIEEVLNAVEKANTSSNKNKNHTRFLNWLESRRVQQRQSLLASV